MSAMDIMEAIRVRESVRSYEDRVMADEKASDLQSYIQELNKESGLSFQFYGPKAEGDQAITMSPKMFAGPVYHYAALVGPDTIEGGDKVGYFGEKLVLYATQLGLGSCWVASTFDLDSTRYELQEGEKLWDVVPLGYATAKVPLKQRIMRSSMRKRDKTPEQLVDADVPFAELPEWFKTAIDAVILGPSAINGQPVVFTWRDRAISADIPDYKRPPQYNDLGIAKLHFQLAAEAQGIKGTWEWGLGGSFSYQA